MHVDHVVINVRDAMDAAVERFRALGFTLTDRGHHSLGSINHLMVFESDYLELVGVPAGAERVRREIADSPAGLDGLVFATDDAAGLHDRLATRGVPVAEVVAFHRPVTIDGTTQRASFKTVRVAPGFVRGGRVYFCEHETPHLVWRPEWQAHRNGVHALAGLTIVVPDPDREATRYADVVGGTVQVCADESEVRFRDCAVRFTRAERYSARYGNAACDAGGRDAFMGALALRTSSLARVRACVVAAPEVSKVRMLPDRIVVSARDAFNAVIEFVE
jgi:catechol 2,3-dioxygenase-like lactoylglutathione lyase family enzyme